MDVKICFKHTHFFFAIHMILLNSLQIDEIYVFEFGNADSGNLFLYIISFLDYHQSKTLNGACMNTCLSVIYSIRKHNLEILSIKVSLL